MKAEREHRFWEVARRRQPDLTVMLENVHDLHNIGAVLRTADSVGITEIYVLQSDPALQFSNLRIGKRTSAGSRRWVDVHYFTDRNSCFEKVREKYARGLGAYLDDDARSVYELDLTKPTALLFGNEKSGLTPETLGMCDGSFVIPQMGMAQSLNISVAGGVCLYEAFRQRQAKGFYNDNLPLDASAQQAIYDEFVRRHEEKIRPKKAGRFDSRL